MVSYPRITAIELANFMSIESARLEFDESGVLNICGYNDSGKSAIIRALEVLFYDAYPNEQVNFIQDGKDYFGVGLEFEDGISINKYKYIDGKSVWEMLKGEEVVFTNQLDNGIAALGDIPDIIKKYLGVVKDDHTDEQLNVRRNTDRLFLINTTGGDNYKIINSVLRCDILAESVKRMNEDRNKLQSEVLNLVTSRDTLKDEVARITVLDDGTIQLLQESSEKLKQLKAKADILEVVFKEKEFLDSFEVYPELSVVDTGRLEDLQRIMDLREQMNIPVYDECKLIDTAKLSMLEEIMRYRDALSEAVPPEVGVVDTQRFQSIMEVAQAYNHLWKVSQEYEQTEKEYQLLLSELQRLSDLYGFKICKNCGTIVV